MRAGSVVRRPPLTSKTNAERWFGRRGGMGVLGQFRCRVRRRYRRRGTTLLSVHRFEHQTTPGGDGLHFPHILVIFFFLRFLCLSKKFRVQQPSTRPLYKRRNTVPGRLRTRGVRRKNCVVFHRVIDIVPISHF